MEGIKMLLSLGELLDMLEAEYGLDYHIIHTYFGGT